MQSVSTTTNRLIFFLIVSVVSIKVSAQENSPFSRYGIGDLYSDQTVGSLAMGGLTAAYKDEQTVNANNPATYSSISFVTYELGLSIDSRTLVDNGASAKYNSVNFIPSYFILGFPLDKKHGMGFAFGIRPLSRINYSIGTNSTVNFNNHTDSLQNVYQGNGGLNQGFVGFGKKFGKDTSRFTLSLGANTGMNFGSSNISTTANIISDTFQYNASNSAVNTDFWGVFLNIGLQTDIKIAQSQNPVTKMTSTYKLRLGGDYTFSQKLHANQSSLDETFYTNSSGAMVPYDTVKNVNNILGNVQIPSSYTAGLSLIKMVSVGNGAFSAYKWMIGAEYDGSKWADYRFYGVPDRTTNNWTGRVGLQYVPDPLYGKTMWSRTTYKLGFNTGKDYIDADGNGLKESGVTFGAGFNIKVRRSYDQEFTLLNTAFEIGKRGTGVNNITENYFKFSLGLSLSDRLWFVKRKYD